VRSARELLRKTCFFAGVCEKVGETGGEKAGELNGAIEAFFLIFPVGAAYSSGCSFSVTVSFFAD